MTTSPVLPSTLLPLAERQPQNAGQQVQLTQRGYMWLKPGARPMSFTAVQHFAVERVAFAWRARFPLGPFSLRVVDDYDRGAGALTVSAFGVPLQRQRGPETTAGEALRYLAELPYVPRIDAEQRTRIPGDRAAAGRGHDDARR